MLHPATLGAVRYSFTLVERTEGGNRVRVQTDTTDQPLDINEGSKLELGSTAKLRVLATYLELVAELHGRLAVLDVPALRRVGRAGNQCQPAGRARRRLRQQENEIPIIMLTAKGDEVDRIIGLEMGADDYLPKPFNPRELLARIRAVMRRKSKELPGAPSQAEGVVEFGPFKFNLATREMRKGDELLPLTSGEYAVLKVLVSHPREPLSRDKLMNQARGRDYSAMERSIDVQVSRLRRMLEDDAANPRYIQTVWGLGYVFVPDGSVN